MPLLIFRRYPPPVGRVGQSSPEPEAPDYPSRWGLCNQKPITLSSPSHVSPLHEPLTAFIVGANKLRPTKVDASSSFLIENSFMETKNHYRVGRLYVDCTGPHGC
ncbi:Hypothetical protein NTJ_02250 [Nesidiocoris tenuis]|uniref:Uncharacterized protein n=1 Tax=Nesidiocoris tenuis TaxID=355587 RepID=A0ABN7AAW1_9HEMI|nr:Hypothetical protein NTJ_02250 [Nesidiocoris tenuis]